MPMIDIEKSISIAIIDTDTDECRRPGESETADVMSCSLPEMCIMSRPAQHSCQGLSPEF
jgi:hypothetical protein